MGEPTRTSLPSSLRSYGTVRADDGDSDSRLVTAVIATGNLARDGAIIEPGGWDFDHYRANPVVLWNHGGGMLGGSDVPIARTVDGPHVNKQTGEITATAEMDGDDPEAMRILSKIRRGFISTTSVRWHPLETEEREVPDERHEGAGEKPKRTVLVFLRQQLLEWSFVPIPSDPAAMIARADGSPFDTSNYLDARSDEERAIEPKTTTTTPNHRSPLAVLLDDADYLRDQIEAYGVEALLDRISDDEMPALRALHELLSRVAPSPATPKPQPKQSQPRPNQGAETLSDDMARELRSVIDAMRDVPTDEDMLVAVLAKQTGRAPGAIREEIRSMV